MPKTTYYERSERRRESLPSVIVGGILGGVLVLGIILAPNYSNEQAPQPTHSGGYHQEQVR